MPAFQTPIFVLDEPAYKERLAIIEVECPHLPILDAIRIATQCAYNTPWSLAVSAAANGDWSLVEKMCEQAYHAAGRRAADDLKCEIFNVVQDALERKGRAPERKKRR